MTLYLPLFLTALNIVFWLFMFVRFKKIFSTDETISKVRKEFDNLLRDINNNAVRNIDLIEDRTNQLNNLINEADRKIQILDRKIELLNKESGMKDIASSINKQIQNTHENTSTNIRPNRMTAKAAEAYKVVYSMPSLETDVIDGVISPPKIHFSENPIVYEKSFNEKVMELYNEGFNVEDISLKLSCSTTEVQFVLDMKN